ncbi:GNAT family N-acetyltransferase [Streptomyces sp. NPDC046866]|uniref:GNAT family N-acetyltransferase n=1 Tax=Streptomyces sp. NPDC046866 TaxID=3154921 RepID=UPI003454A8DB
MTGRLPQPYPHPPSGLTLTAAATPTAPALLLRPWRPQDAPALVEAYRDPELLRWTSHRMANEADGLRWVGEQERRWAAGDRFCFAVVESGPDGAPGRLAGSAVLKEVVPGAPSAEVGYWTAGPARGRGVAPRALEAVTAWAFDTFRAEGLERVELIHRTDNAASCRVAQKSGYAFAGLLPPAPPAFPLEGHLHVRHAAP